MQGYFQRVGFCVAEGELFGNAHMPSFEVVAVEGFVVHIFVVAREDKAQAVELFHAHVAIHNGIGFDCHTRCAESLTGSKLCKGENSLFPVGGLVAGSDTYDIGIRKIYICRGVLVVIHGMSSKMVGQIGVGVEIAQQFHLSPTNAECGSIGAGLQGQVGNNGVELFRQETVGRLIIIVAEDNILNHVDVIHHNERLRRGGESVAQPMDSRVCRQPVMCGEKAVECRGDIVVGNRMCESSGALDERGPEYERHVM